FATGVSFMSGASPTDTGSSWTWRGDVSSLNWRDSYGNVESGHNWVATEFFADPEDGREDFANDRSVDFATFEVGIRRVRWVAAPAAAFTLEPPFHVIEIDPQPPSAGKVQFQFTAIGANTDPHVVPIEIVQVGGVHDGQLIPNASIGMPPAANV